MLYYALMFVAQVSWILVLAWMLAVLAIHLFVGRTSRTV
jgi:hypothetical protein